MAEIAGVIRDVAGVEEEKMDEDGATDSNDVMQVGGVEEEVTDEDDAVDSNDRDEKLKDLRRRIRNLDRLLIDPTDRAILPLLGDYIRIMKEYGALTLSLPDDIQFSGKTQCTLLNIARLPDMFTATGGIGPATPGAGIDDALLVIGERACNEMIYSLTGMRNCSLLFDISHHQHKALASSLDLRDKMRSAQMVTAEVIADHVSNVLGVASIEGHKYGFSCGKNANWTLDDTKQCTGAGTLDVINRIGALPVANLTYPRDDGMAMDAIVERYVLEKFRALERVGAFDGKFNPVAAEYVKEMEAALAALKASAKEAMLKRMKAMSAAEVARRARDGRTAAQLDHNVNVWQPAAVARRARNGATAAQRDNCTNVWQPAGTAAAKMTNTRANSTAAQRDSRANKWAPAGNVARQAQAAAVAAANGNPICVRAGCTRTAVRIQGQVLKHGRCRVCK